MTRPATFTEHECFHPGEKPHTCDCMISENHVGPTIFEDFFNAR